MTPMKGDVIVKICVFPADALGKNFLTVTQAVRLTY